MPTLPRTTHSKVQSWGYPPDPHFRTGMEDRRGTVTDAQSTTSRLCSSAAAPVTGAEAPRHPMPRCQGTKCRPGTPRYSEIGNFEESVVGHFCGRESNCQILCRSLELLVWCFQEKGGRRNFLFWLLFWCEWLCSHKQPGSGKVTCYLRYG